MDEIPQFYIIAGRHRHLALESCLTQQTNDDDEALSEADAGDDL